MAKRKELVIVKLGGSVITLKASNRLEVNTDNLQRLAKEISEARKLKGFSLVIVHGAGPFGHVPAKKYGLGKGSQGVNQVEGFSETHSSMVRLNSIVVEALCRKGLNAVAFQPSAGGILRDGKLVKFPIDVMENMIGMGLVPVAYGDVLFDEEKGASILSGDHLVPYLADRLKAGRVIMVADVGGIYDKDPKKNMDAKVMRELGRANLHEIKEIGPSTGVDVTGGMEKKLEELLELADKGIESEIISGVEPGLLKRSLLGEKGLGTIIKKKT